MYFETVEAYRKANPEKPLPGDLVNVYGYCADDVFFLYLDKLLDITVSTPGHSIPADSYAYDLRVSVADRRLPVETLITLIDRLKKQNYADRDLLNGVVRSLATYPGDEPARQRAALWADELIRSADSQLWKSGMGLFRHGFGTRAVALAAARKHLAADPQTAAPLLAQIGREADAAAIYAATHDPPGAKPALPKDRYSRVAIGWTPIVLLTNP